MRLRLLLAAVCAAALIPATAQASSFAINPEPAYTKGATNTWFITRYHGAEDTWFYLCTTATADGAPLAGEQSNGANGPSTTNCTSNSPLGTSSLAMKLGAPTASGHAYALCASGYVDWPIGPGDIFWNNVGTSCQQTTLDDSKPVLTPSFGAAITHDPQATLTIAYDDTVSPPWAGDGGLLACITRGDTCTPTAAGADACADAAATRSTSYRCPVTLTEDGLWRVCVRGADSAVPDTTSWQSAGPAQANLSDLACTTITLDRSAPPVVTPPVVTPPVVTPPVVTPPVVTPPASAGSITLRVPKTQKRSRRTLPLAFTADRAGRASVTLFKGARVIAGGSKRLGPGTTAYALRLPARRPAAGRYVVSVSFVARGAVQATTRVAKVRFVR
jgi:hypothetical protein